MLYAKVVHKFVICTNDHGAILAYVIAPLYKGRWNKSMGIAKWREI